MKRGESGFWLFMTLFFIVISFFGFNVTGLVIGEDEVLGVLSGNQPTHTTPILNSTGTNFTTHNLTVFNQTTSDPEGDNVKNIYNWYQNGTSIPVLNMPFEGEANLTNVRDYSSYGNNGTNFSATFFSTGGHDNFGYFLFDGDGDYVDLPGAESDLSFTGPGLLSFWVKTENDSCGNVLGLTDYDNADPRYQLTIKIGDGCTGSLTNEIITLARDDDGVAGHYIAGYETATRTELIDGNWHHVIVGYNGTGIVFYVDGEQKQTTIGVDPDPAGWGMVNVDTITIGMLRHKNGDEIQHLNASLDEIMIFDEWIPAEQITKLYLKDYSEWHSSMTNLGDVFNVTVTPNDGSSDGNTLWTNSLTIRDNAVPSVTSLIINSTSTANYTNGTLQTYYNFSDGNGDSEQDKETQWWRGSVLNTTFTNLTTIDSGNFTANITWNFSVRVYDGMNWSDWSDNVTINLTTTPPSNIIPTVTNVLLNSTSTTNYSNGTLQCYWDFSDDDVGDTEQDNETRWWEGSVLNTTFANFTTIESANMTKGDVWNFSVRVYDGTEWSVWSNNFSISIVNAPPDVGTLNVSSTSSQNYTNGSLYINWSINDIDTDTETDNETQWWKGSVKQNLTNLSWIDSGNTSNGEIWNASVRVYDGTAWSAWSNNVSIEIGNQAPEVTNFILNSSSPDNYSNSSVQIYWDFSDGDGDSHVMNESQWWKNGVKQNWTNFTTIVQQNISSGVQLNASVRVHDGTAWSAWSNNLSIWGVATPVDSTVTPNIPATSEQPVTSSGSSFVVSDEEEVVDEEEDSVVAAEEVVDKEVEDEEEREEALPSVEEEIEVSWFEDVVEGYAKPVYSDYVEPVVDLYVEPLVEKIILPVTKTTSFGMAYVIYELVSYFF